MGFVGGDPTRKVSAAYLSSVDGFGIEELFYNGTAQLDSYRLEMLRTLSETKKIMVSEFVLDTINVASAIQNNLNEGFICFPRNSTNYNYTQIPNVVSNENSNDILTLGDAQNYLYLISTDSFVSKLDMINTIASTNFDVVLIDLFFEETPFTALEIEQLKTKANGGKRIVLSYINIGAAESYRYYWEDDWKKGNPNFLKKPYEGYEDELWVKFWKQDWKDIIYGNDNSYIKKIINAGFDGAYLDNVEAYYFLYFDD
ncbi:MAG: endo alpha-1,4 polygalactosaminidase [Crocinitomicaceae bacterium]|nr:endo alpha-1,4 polygalactosaminidase [Crocinitomicaceae bacterium]